MPQRNAAAGISCVFEGTHVAEGGTLPENKEESGSIPRAGRCARGNRGASWFGSVTPSGFKRLQEPAL